MNDAPRWPGADGSPGLQFARKGEQTDEKPVEPSSVASPDDVDATQKVDTASAQDEKAAKSADVPDQGRPAFAAPGRKSQNADDWELDSITRSSAKAAPGKDGEEKTPSLTADDDTTVSAPYEETKPSRAVSSDSASAPAPSVAPARAARRTRKARLRINRLDPWSVMKTSFLFSIAFAVMAVAAVSVIWSVFAGSDTLTYINDLINSVVADPQGGNRFDINEFLSFQRVIGLTTVLSAINVIIFTAVATLFAFLYNLASVIMGGLEITLAED